MSSSKAEVQRAFPRSREAVLKWNGWGYKDSGFVLNQKGIALFSGKRYAVCGKEMPLLRPWFENRLKLDLSQTSFSQPPPLPKDIPPPIPCLAFVEDIRHHCVTFSDEAVDRLMRSHGQLY